MDTEYERAVYKGEDVTGQVFGSYKVLGKTGIKEFPSGNTHHIWRVVCLLCEMEMDKQAQQVFNAKYGCNKCLGRAMSGSNSCHWKGGEIVPGYFLAKIKTTLQRGSRTIDFDLTCEYLDEVWKAQGGRCVYTGWPLDFGKSKILGSASLDRIDSLNGYVKGNVQFVHKEVNTMKWDLSDSRFREICTAIHERGLDNK